MSSPRQRPKLNYKVSSIVPEDDFSTAGQIVPSQRVHFTTDRGVVGSVLVPNSQINQVAHVQALVEGQINALHSVLDLGQ